MHSRTKEPFVRIAKRDKMPMSKVILVRILAIVIALLVCALVEFAIVRLGPMDVYGAMVSGAFGTVKRTWITIRDAMMLLCIGVALAPAFKMRFWNIGAEGQILVGGIATAACMIYFGNAVPTPLLLVIMFVVSAAAGALWGLFPAIFKARWNTNETLFTLMMNYIAIQLTNFFVSKWEHPAGSNAVGIINMETKGGWFPAVFGQQYMLNLLIVGILTVVMYFYLKKSKHGYELTVVGESERTARYIGINVRKVMIRTMLLSGAICGVAGFIAVAGASHTISADTAGGRGFTAIIVAWLAKFNTYIMVAIAFLLVFLESGASEIASQFNLNEYAGKILTGIILFFILASEFFVSYKLVFRGRKEEEA